MAADDIPSLPPLPADRVGVPLLPMREERAAWAPMSASRIPRGVSLAGRRADTDAAGGMRVVVVVVAEMRNLDQIGVFRVSVSP